MALLLALVWPGLLVSGAQAAETRTVLVMGDSLSAAYGLSPQQGWVALLAEQLAASRPQLKVANASVSGETTAGGASRIGAELARHTPDVVVIELGANDGLRGLGLEQTKANLERMVIAAKESGARVLLLGMRIPPNYGPQYTQGFERNYRELAETHAVALLPFFLEPIATDRDAFQADNLHPVAAAQPRLRDHVWPALEPLLD
ncbi:arylesterase [Arenimonas daejeonensis]|uniref:arylesterase n=1 Tax=Arenimonas daejeonensis TaxID=370777 RepID=UPI001D1420D4|nr:arylesterase [Arenimonas daejeonensis]